MPQLPLTWTPEEATALLAELMEQDCAIDHLRRQFTAARLEAKVLRAALRVALAHRRETSLRVRAGAIVRVADEPAVTLAEGTEPDDLDVSA